MVVEKLGASAWRRALEASGIEPFEGKLPHPDDIGHEEAVLSIINSLCRMLGVRITDVAEAFGEYWVCTHAPRLYKNFGILASNSREFLEGLNQIHSVALKSLEGKWSPRFHFSWKDENTLVLAYSLRWDLMPFFIGLVKGVGRYYGEDLSVNMWSPNQMLIQFPDTRESLELEYVNSGQASA
jgi:hypothetical protein